MIVKIKLGKRAKMPIKAHKSDACYDVYATTIRDHGDGRIEYGLGVSLQPELLGTGIQFDFRPRSSIHKTGLVLSNAVGTGDEGFTGEYSAVFYNVIPSLPNYKIGDRILQMQVTKPIDVDFEVVEELEATDRNSGSFGSSGLT